MKSSSLFSNPMGRRSCRPASRSLLPPIRRASGIGVSTSSIFSNRCARESPKHASIHYDARNATAAPDMPHAIFIRGIQRDRSAPPFFTFSCRRKQGNRRVEGLLKSSRFSLTSPEHFFRCYPLWIGYAYWYGHAMSVGPSCAKIGNVHGKLHHGMNRGMRMHHHVNLSGRMQKSPRAR